MTKDAKNLIVGLDIGTSKVVAVVAEVHGRRRARGHRPGLAARRKGLKKGVVVNIDATVRVDPARARRKPS